MRLGAGTRLGPYEIASLVGAGGMGEIYKARDTRLDRIVAIKVLPPILATDPALRERFEREARAISNVNHPNICTLFDLGRESGTDYLVMEFLEGETLAARLERGALPYDHALSIAIEIASALDTAHRRGIIHRDLKPGNVMLVRRAGLSGAPVAKLLDFGLAKLADAEPPAAGRLVATMTQPLTQQGTILGTFQYMAPEQLEGGDADARSDMFAFGSVFYEMLTGRRAFQGKSQASLISAILKDQPPPVSTVQTITPAAVDRIVARCLAKDPDERWQTASDLAAELRWVQQGGVQGASAATSAGPTELRWREITAWILAVAGLAAAAVLLLLRPGSSAPRSTMRFEIEEPPEAQFQNAPIAPFPAISPDGKWLAFVTRGTTATTLQLAMRNMESGAVRILAGTEGTLPFWSPDSRFIAFHALVAGRLQKYDLSSGTVQTITDLPSFEGGTWNRDGVIIYGTPNGGLFMVPAAGGRPEQVTKLNASKAETSHRWPVFMPDGRHYVFVVQPTNTLRFGMLGSADSKDLTATEGKAIYSSGYLLYGIQNVLQARRFDPATGAFGKGDAEPIADGVRIFAQNARAAYSVSDTGILVYRTGIASQSSHLQWYDRSGKPRAEVMPYADYRSVSLSPDGTRIAFHKHELPDGGGVWIKDLAHGTVTRVTFNSHGFEETWHPDGRRIVFARSDRATDAQPGTTLDIVMTTANGTGDVERLVSVSNSNVWPELSPPDGKVLLYEVRASVAAKFAIWAMPMDTRKPAPYIQGPANESQAAFSPDGKWVAYVSDESGRPEVYVQPYPANGDKWTVSTAGGIQPRWRSDGREMFFLAPSQQIEAVDITVKGDRFDAAVPHSLFPVRAVMTGGGALAPNRSYSVAADGQSFLIDESAPEQLRHDPLTVVLNWTALLRR